MRTTKDLENKQFAKQLEQRTRDFAVRIIKISMKLPDWPESEVIRNQITKAGTSIGANYREANRARSRADFKSKINICESEASETPYWLEIVRDIGWLPRTHLEPEYQECSELLAIFASIGRKR